jgi:hypothetical protein
VTYDTDALIALRERVRATPAHDVNRDLDKSIWVALGQGQGPFSKSFVWSVIPCYCDSIDAALALVERVFQPDCVNISCDPSGHGAELGKWPNGLSDVDNYVKFSGWGWSFESAIIDALLTALIDQETTT